MDGICVNKSLSSSTEYSKSSSSVDRASNKDAVSLSSESESGGGGRLTCTVLNKCGSMMQHIGPKLRKMPGIIHSQFFVIFTLDRSFARFIGGKRALLLRWSGERIRMWGWNITRSMNYGNMTMTQSDLGHGERIITISRMVVQGLERRVPVSRSRRA